MVLILILLTDTSWEEPISYVLAILGALVLRNAFEWDNNTLTKKTFITRLLYTIGITIGIFLFLGKDLVIFGFAVNRALALFGSTLISDYIVKGVIALLIFANDKFLKKQQSKIE